MDPQQLGKMNSQRGLFNEETVKLFVKGRRLLDAMSYEPGRLVLASAMEELSENINLLINLCRAGYKENRDKIEQVCVQIATVVDILEKWSTLIKQFYTSEEKDGT